MLINDNKKRINWVIIGSLIGAFAFIGIYGVKVLNPFYYDWVFVGGDLAQSFFGWIFYLQSSGECPFYAIDGLTFPYTLSMIFMDFETPMALIMKPLCSLFLERNEVFQICGIWSFMNYVLQGMAAGIIMKKISKENIIRIFGIVVLVCSPYLIQRTFYHITLASQYIILYAFAIWLYEEELENRKYFLWILLTIYGTITHIYFSPILAIIMGFALLYDYLKNKKMLKPITTYILAGCLSVFAVYLLGGFTCEVIDADEQWGERVFCQYSSNINTFFNSEGHSLFLPALPEFNTEYEGFGYLGLGLIILLFIEVIWLIVKHEKMRKWLEKNKNTCLCLMGTFAVAFVIAVGPRITLGENILFFVPIPNKLHFIFRIFRSIGRFIWIAAYLLIILEVKLLDRIFVYSFKNKKIGKTIVIMILAVQILDLYPYMEEKHAVFANEVVFDNCMQDTKWEELAKGHSEVYIISANLMLIPTEQTNSMHMYAYENEMKMTTSRVAHQGEFMYNKSMEYLEEIRNGIVQKDAIYWFETEEYMQMASKYMHCEVIDGFYIGWVE